MQLLIQATSAQYNDKASIGVLTMQHAAYE